MDELFVRCDKSRSGQIKKSRFLMKLAKYQFKLPNQLLLNILRDIQLDQNDKSKDAILIYTNL